MKKIITLLSFMFCFSLFTFAQSDDSETFVRKGRFLVETGYNIVGGFNSSTGANILVDFDGGSLTALGADVGKFISEDVALKFKLSLLSGEGLSLTNIAGGVKYYAGGKVPIELTAGLLDGGPGSSVFTANFRFGYAANLADNITLEPTIGLVVIDGEGALNFGMNFGMFL